MKTARQINDPQTGAYEPPPPRHMLVHTPPVTASPTTEPDYRSNDCASPNERQYIQNLLAKVARLEHRCALLTATELANESEIDTLQKELEEIRRKVPTTAQAMVYLSLLRK